MALDLGLDEAFEELTQRLTMKNIEGSSDMANSREEENMLMRKSRVWFGLLVLEHMYYRQTQDMICMEADDALVSVWMEESRPEFG
jgi:hypothetical protein